MTPADRTRLKERVARYATHQAIMQAVAAEIMEYHYQTSAREIAKLLLDAAGVEVGP
jgi:hypothetical protein